MQNRARNVFDVTFFSLQCLFSEIWQEQLVQNIDILKKTKTLLDAKLGKERFLLKIIFFYDAYFLRYDEKNTLSVKKKWRAHCSGWILIYCCVAHQNASKYVNKPNRPNKMQPPPPPSGVWDNMDYGIYDHSKLFKASQDSVFNGNHKQTLSLSTKNTIRSVNP